MPFPRQTHFQAPQLIFEVCRLQRSEGNHVDVQINSEQHPPTYRLKRGRVTGCIQAHQSLLVL